MTTGRSVLVALILASAGVFVVGVTVERHETRNESAETPAQRAGENRATGRAAHDEAAENNPSMSTAAAKPTRGERGHAESSEKLLGINPESTELVGLAVAVSLLLALAVWRTGDAPLVLGAVALAMAAFAVLDLREVVHQLDESRAGLAILAASVAGLHLAAALLAGRMAARAPDRGPPPSHRR